MTRFVARRAASGVVLIATLTFLTFLVFNAIPTKPACLIVECGPHTTADDATIRAADHRLGIDRPVLAQYGTFVWRLLRHGGLGTAWTSGRSVRAEVAAALPVTASLVAGGMILMVLLALALGSFAATRPRTSGDHALLAVSSVGLAVHPFVLGIGLQQLFARYLGAPASSYCPLRSEAAFGCGGVAAWAGHLAVPWLVFALLFLPLYMRMTRAGLIETLNEPWIATARAKGASESRVLLVHALRNAIAPIVPLLAIDAGTALTAAIYIETVFGLPGLGHLAVQAFSGEAGGYDLPLTAGLVTTVGGFVVALNLLADVGGAWIDPRLRLQGARPRLFLPIVAHRRLRLAATAAAFVVVAAGAFAVGRHTATTTKQPATAVRTYRLHFVDSFDLSPGSLPGVRLKTQVSRLDVGPDGWRVFASLTNNGDAPISLLELDPSSPAVHYPTQGMSLVVMPSAADRAEGQRDFSILSARSFTPALPRVLAPHQTWSGSFAGPNEPPRNRKIYVGFGTFLIDSQAKSVTTAQSLTVK